MDDIKAIRDALDAGPTFELRAMNLRCDVDNSLPNGCGETMAYKYGHRDARYAAAELAAEADEQIARLLDALEAATRDAERWRHVRAATEIADTVLTRGPAAELDAEIDAAMAASAPESPSAAQSTP